MNKALREKILDPNCPTILYELIPPMGESTPEKIEAHARCAVELITSTPFRIDAINIPELHDEKRNGQFKQEQPHSVKLDPRVFAKLLRDISHDYLEIIVNRCSVYADWPTQQLWLQETSRRYEINNLIIVGGESSKIAYPGPSVIEMGQYLKTYSINGSFFWGGITIPTRRRTEAAKDEPYRLIEKALNGFEFFTSQVLYEANSIQRLLKDYYILCQQRSVAPKRIFLSFAPISTHNDLDFLRWLGVEIPSAVEIALCKADIGMGWRSVKIVKTILQDILVFVQKEQIKVPLGLNIEHITRHNFELSKEFIIELGNLYSTFMRH